MWFFRERERESGNAQPDEKFCLKNSFLVPDATKVLLPHINLDETGNYSLLTTPYYPYYQITIVQQKFPGPLVQLPRLGRTNIASMRCCPDA